MKKMMLIMVLALSTGTLATAQTEPESKSLANIIFDTIDVTDKSYLNHSDVEIFRQQVFTSMDAYNSYSIELNEFLSWDYGFELAAKETGGTRLPNRP